MIAIVVDSKSALFTQFVVRVLTLAILPIAGITTIAHAEGVDPIQEIFEPAGEFPPDQFMKVAVIQSAPPDAALVETAEEAERYKRRNRELLKPQIIEAANNGAKIVIASEMVVVGYPDIPELGSEDDNFRTREEVLPYAEVIPGPSTNDFSELARELGIFLQFGMVEHDKTTGNLHNVAVAIDPTGAIVAKHRKNNLYHQEGDYFTPGNGGSTYATPAGDIGLLICADVYDQALLQEYREQNVSTLALSTSWAQMNTGWSYFTNAAKRVNAHLLAANQPYFPDSGVIEPDGRTQSHIRQTSGIAYGYLPLKR